MAALFLVSAAVQYNDPSPWGWVALYLSAAVATSLLAAGRRHRWLFGAVMVVCMAWEIHYLQLGAWHTPFGDLVQEWHMTGEQIVDGREFYALIWIGLWMLLGWFTPIPARADAKSDRNTSV
jgi:hypothetical protein